MSNQPALSPGPCGLCRHFAPNASEGENMCHSPVSPSWLCAVPEESTCAVYREREFSPASVDRWLRALQRKAPEDRIAYLVDAYNHVDKIADPVVRAVSIRELQAAFRALYNPSQDAALPVVAEAPMTQQTAQISIDALRQRTLQELEDTLDLIRRLHTEADALEGKVRDNVTLVSDKRNEAQDLLRKADRLRKHLEALGLGAVEDRHE